MEIKAELPASLLQGQNISPSIRAYYEFNHLKQLYRQGWLQRGIPKERAESVAEHIFGVAALAWFIADSLFPELDSAHVLRLALLHDFGEIYAGDIIPSDEVPQTDKHRLERQAVEEIFTKLPQGESYLALWQEYEAGETPEARFVKGIDRLEMALQASIYEHQGYPEMQDFFASARQGLSDPRLVEVFTALEALRPQKSG